MLAKVQHATKLAKGTASLKAESPRLTIKEETFGKIADELPSLLTRVKTDRITIDPDWARLLRMAVSGNLRAMTVRHGKSMVGCALSTVGSHLINKTIVQAVTFFIWLDPLYRYGWLGVKFTKANRDMLLKAGANRLCVMHAPKDARLAKIYRRAGYKLDEIAYALEKP